MKTTTRPLSIGSTAPRRRNQRKAFVLIGAALAALSSVIAYAVTTRPEPRDIQHCLIGRAPERSAIFLVDLTDAQPMTDAQFARLRSDVEIAADALASGDRLQIVTLGAEDGTNADMQIAFAGCRPIAPDNGGLTQGRHVLERQQHADWSEPIAAALRDIRSRPVAPAASTPLIATIKALLARAAGVQRRLYVYSDLLEHTGTVSMYRAAPRFDALRESRVDAVSVDGLFDGIEVEIVELQSPRAAALQARSREFWDRWLAAAGGRVRHTRL